MRIDFSGRIGVGLILFAVAADIVLRLIWEFDDPHFGVWKPSDAYLPFVFLIGLALLVHSINIGFQGKRVAELAKYPLTTVGPLPPGPQWEAGQAEARQRSPCKSPVQGDELPPPQLAFVPSPSHRKLLQRVGRDSILLAGLLYVSVEAFTPSYMFWVYRVTDLVFYILTALGITLLFWPDVRETEELSLQGEMRATYRGMAHGSRTLRPLIALMPPLSSLRTCSYMAVMVLMMGCWFKLVLSPLTPQGLMVCVSIPGPYSRTAGKPWNEPLVLRISAQRSFYLNRQPVPRAELQKRLRDALSRRANWWVFLDADPDLAAGEVIEAVDIIHGAGDTMVILVTPSMKNENPALAAFRPCGAEPLYTKMLEPPSHWAPRSTSVHFSSPIVSFTIGERGEVSTLKFKKTSGIPEIDEWIVHSMRKWKYKPVPGCEQVEKETSLTIDFH